MPDEPKAACAHLRVAYKPIDNGDGSLSERWQCELCGHAFKPVRKLAKVTVENAARIHEILHPLGACTCHGEGKCAWCSSICPACGGDGMGTPCDSCGGSGWRDGTMPEPEAATPESVVYHRDVHGATGAKGSEPNAWRLVVARHHAEAVVHCESFAEALAEVEPTADSGEAMVKQIETPDGALVVSFDWERKPTVEVDCPACGARDWRRMAGDPDFACRECGLILASYYSGQDQS
jgi:hypothetical protein